VSWAEKATELSVSPFVAYLIGGCIFILLALAAAVAGYYLSRP
jgi:hypothetical protein